MEIQDLSKNNSVHGPTFLGASEISNALNSKSTWCKPGTVFSRINNQFTHDSTGKVTGAVYLLSLATLFLISCDKRELDKQTAKKLIIKEYQLPKIVDHTISTGDPSTAKQLLDLGFENEGLVKITRSQTLSQMGTPWIEFTAKGKAYFVPTPEEESRYQRQNVKLAIKEFGEIKGIVMGKENKTALVEFSITFKDQTPFAKLSKGLSEPKNLEAFFIRYDTGWKIDNKKGSYMLMGF